MKSETGSDRQPHKQLNSTWQAAWGSRRNWRWQLWSCTQPSWRVTSGQFHAAHTLSVLLKDKKTRGYSAVSIWRVHWKLTGAR